MPILFDTLPQHQILGRLIGMRGITIVGHLLVIGVMHFAMAIGLSTEVLISLLMVIAFLCVFNGLTWWRMRCIRPAGEIELFLQLFVDVNALSLLLYFSGGATNPFVSFYLPALAVAAAILPWRLTFFLALYSFASYSLLSYVYLPLRIHDHTQAMAYHLAGMWVNFAISAILITWFVTRISSTLRVRDAQLTQARERYQQGERIIALGTQAASAAHEMGTPLSTVAVIAADLRNESQRNPGLAIYSADLATIEQQITLCKMALDRMNANVDIEASDATMQINLNTWLKKFSDDWRRRFPAIRMTVLLPNHGVPITPAAHPQALAQILQILLDNAARAVTEHDGQLELALSLDATQQIAYIRVTDNGVGIDAVMLKRLGYEPVHSTYGGKGIGLMLAFATARQMGAEMTLSSQQGKGTVAELVMAVV